MPNIFDLRQTQQRSSLPFITGAANSLGNAIVSAIDAELAKLFEDRNVLLTQGGLITYTGTQIQFGEALKLEINSKVAGGSPVIIDLGSTTRTVSASGRMVYAVINRTAGTATVTDDATTLPAVTNANQEVFLIAKRQDAADGTKRVYFRTGAAFNEGQTARLGSAGSGSGTGGAGDDINTLRFKASFSDDFSDSPTSSTSAVNNTLTTGVYSAAGAAYRLSYDASKTVTGTGTSMTLSATPTYTVAPGDILVVGTEARRITVVATQTSYTIEAAFSANPSAAAACVSQAVHTNDIRAHTENSTGLAMNALISDAVSTFMLRYRDSAANNDFVWDYPGAALIAASSSADNANWSAPYTRTTTLGTTEPIRSVPVSGSQFRTRFFANATSGSGAVNILDYKAYLHEDSGTTSGTTMDQAYGLTSGAGTPINCSISSSTGKTRITTTWAYATGVNPGTQQGQLDVYLDGKLLPRFINATQTPDAYYTEISAQVIELDQDYSGAGIEIDIKKRVSAVDTTSQNSTNLGYLQDMSKVGFQGFVDESSLLSPITGAPSSSQFRTFGIVNRASIPNLSNDLRARMGIDRIQVQQAVELQNEVGPNGEKIFGALNDDRNLIRFVGNWKNLTNTFGSVVNPSAVGDYIEVVFYGTGLNMLVGFVNETQDIRVIVDGGSEGSNIWPNGSTLLNGRNYSQNAVLSIASGLSQGLHTVRIRQANLGSSGVYLTGFEILNESSTINVRPGTSYQNGKKLVLSSAQSLAYNSSFESILRDGSLVGSLSTRGAHVVVYQKSDGTVAKAAIETNSSAAYITSADHTNEEVARTYYPREFGAGRSDDFSTLLSSGSTRAFTLDDGTTALACQNYALNNVGGLGDGLIVGSGAGDFVTFTFVGTGLDITNVRNATSNSSYTITVDGTNVLTASVFGGSGFNNVLKIASGLPYGTHTVKINMTTNGGVALAIGKFIVYQPKKPSIPAGAVELADYNVMADFIANTTVGVDTISTGILRKNCTREGVYFGTGWTLGLGPINNSGGFSSGGTTVTSGAYIEYTFFGTGFDFRGFGGVGYTTNTQVTLNGLNATTTNFPSLVSSAISPFTFTASTGVLTQNGANTAGAGFRISGLPLAKYTVRFTNNANATYLDMSNIDVITPIHSVKSNFQADLQNTLPVGSCALSDNRRLSAVKSEDPAKATIQAIGISSVSTTSTVPVPIPDATCVVRTTKPLSYIEVWFTGSATNTSNGNFVQGVIYVDNLPVAVPSTAYPLSGNGDAIVCHAIVPVGAGTHTITTYWKVSAGTGSFQSNSGENRILTVREL
jgi:hypothetical protein